MKGLALQGERRLSIASGQTLVVSRNLFTNRQHIQHRPLKIFSTSDKNSNFLGLTWERVLSIMREVCLMRCNCADIVV